MIQSADITLNDTQIKALRTSAVQITNFAGPGKIIFPIAALLVNNFTSGYGNTASARLVLGVTPFNADFRVMGFVDESDTSLLASIGAYAINFPTISISQALDVETRGFYLPDQSGYVNKPIYLYIAGGVGALTLGNAANTLRVKFYYTVETLS